MTPDQIRAIRQARGWSQTDLANWMGIARRQTVGEWEAGEYEPSGPARKLLELLEENLKLGGEDE